MRHRAIIDKIARRCKQTGVVVTPYPKTSTCPIRGWRSDEMSANRPNEASATTCLRCGSSTGRFCLAVMMQWPTGPTRRLGSDP